MASKEYKKIRKIGEGGYGKVYTVQRYKDSKIFAMKQIKSKKVSNEVLVMNFLNHENLLKTIDSKEVIRRNSNGVQYEAKLIFEYFPANLHEYFYEKLIHSVSKPFAIKLVMNQILKGVEHLHSFNIGHCDLKLRNILVSDCFRVKICDFGMSKILIENQKKSVSVQTLNYTAPEILIGYRYYDKSIDLWSIGCIFGELFKCEKLFKGNTDEEQLEKIIDLCGWFSSSFIIKINSTCSDIKLKHQAKKRSLRSYLECFIDEYEVVDLIDCFLQMDPDTRISASQALNRRYFRSIEVYQDVSNEQ